MNNEVHYRKSNILIGVISNIICAILTTFLISEAWKQPPSFASRIALRRHRSLQDEYENCCSCETSEVELFGKTYNIDNTTDIIVLEDNFSGKMSTNIGLLTKLTNLVVDGGVLKGGLPTQLGMLTDLTHLELHHEFTGTIPSEVGLLTELKYIYLMATLQTSDNKLTGSIPLELGNLNKLTDLSLGFNRLTGTIPPQLGNLVQLENLYLSDNRLSGSIPSEFGNLIELENLWLSLNFLSKNIPSELGNLNKISFLLLSGNFLSGSIPPQLENLTNLQYFTLRSNELKGSIPLSFCEMDQARNIAVDCEKVICHCCVPTCTQYTQPSISSFPSESPTISLRPTISKIPSMVPSTHPSLALSNTPSSRSSEFPSKSETPSSSQSPSLLPALEIIVIIEMKLGNKPSYAGWSINNVVNKTVHEISVGTYNQYYAYKTVYEEVVLNLESIYTFNLLPGFWCGITVEHVVIYLGDTPDRNNVLGYYADSGVSSSVYEIPFLAGEKGIIEITFPTMSPSKSPYPTSSPSLRPSKLPSTSRKPSSSPSQSIVPSASQMPTQKTIIVTIELQLDYAPWKTGWNITDSDNNTIHENPFFSYSSSEQREIVYEQVVLIFGSNYTFKLLALHERGQRGQVIIYLGDSPDVNKILGYYVDSGAYFSVYEIQFLSNEEGIIENIFPTMLPSTSNNPTDTFHPSELPTNKPTSRPSESTFPSRLPTVSQAPTSSVLPTREPCPPVPAGVGGCSICGEGRCVRNTDVIFEFESFGIPAIPCGELELNGFNNKLTFGWSCLQAQYFLSPYLNQVCGCA